MPTQLNLREIITEFARSLHNTEDFISKARADSDQLHSRYNETCQTVFSKYTREEKDNSFSWQNFYLWFANFFSFYVLIFSGLRHTALRELRFHFESSVRACYLDTKYDGKTYEEKVTILTIFKPRKTEKEMKMLKALLCEKQYDKVKRRTPRFGELIIDVPNREQLKSFYSELCNYVHLSEIAQTDALRDFGLDLMRKHPYYEKDREMLDEAYEHSRCLLLRALEKE